jgi:hypothetical protein
MQTNAAILPTVSRPAEDTPISYVTIIKSERNDTLPVAKP